MVEEGRAKRPDLAALAEDLEEIGSAYRIVHGSLRGALQELVDAAARRVVGADDGDAGSFVDPQTGAAMPRA